MSLGGERRDSLPTLTAQNDPSADHLQGHSHLPLPHRVWSLAPAQAPRTCLTQAELELLLRAPAMSPELIVSKEGACPLWELANTIPKPSPENQLILTPEPE